MGDGAQRTGLLQLAKHQGPHTAQRIPEEPPHWQILNQLFQQPATRLSDMASTWTGAASKQKGGGEQGQRVL